MITGPSMQAMTLTAPPHLQQVSMSMLNTRLRRCAQIMDARCSAGVGGSSNSQAFLLPLPRLLVLPERGAFGSAHKIAGSNFEQSNAGYYSSTI